jgi:hypothetical protein
LIVHLFDSFQRRGHNQSRERKMWWEYQLRGLAEEIAEEKVLQ